MLGFYWASLILVHANRLTIVKHKKIWNWILSVSFLGSGSLGLLLAFLIDRKLSIAWYKNILWFHVEFGIVMALVAIFHFGWHLRYFFPKK